MFNKPDGPSREICAGLRKTGAFVQQITSASGGKGCPDIMVAWKGRLVLMEIKTAKGKLSAEQEHWHAACAASGVKVHVVRSVQDALSALGMAK
jgi:hypothetical protein